MEGENGFTVYLAFRQRVSSESIFFNGLVGFYGAQLEASAISCPRALFCFFTRSLGHSVNTSCHTNCCPKTDFLIPIFTDEKDATSALGFQPITSPLSSSFTPSGDLFGLLSLTSVCPLLYPSSHREQTSVGFHSDLDLLLRHCLRNWPTFLIPLLAAC